MVRKIAISAALAAAALGLSGGPAAAAGKTSAQLAAAYCTVTNGVTCSSSWTIPANPSTHSLNYALKAGACWAEIYVKDASNHAIVKHRWAPPGATVEGKIPEAGDAPGGLWGSYYVAATGCNGSRGAISN
jgi:hypothetical protein|uniref:hypothetical protein n=1 Tax=Nonomuraea sp. CA-252377 TaxID=3240003 RepID=UPI003F4982F1